MARMLNHTTACLVLLAAGGLLLTGCRSTSGGGCSGGSCSGGGRNRAPQPALAAGPAASPAPSAALAAAPYGGQKTCPVMGEELGSMGPPVPVTIKGQTIYVCCKGCARKVQADPDKYLAIVQAEIARR